MRTPTPVALAAAPACGLTAVHPSKPLLPPGQATWQRCPPSTSTPAPMLPPKALHQPIRAGRWPAAGAGHTWHADNMETPVLHHQLHQRANPGPTGQRGEVLLNDPGVRVARGFGNFQESFFIRGFVLSSDDIAYNGLYSRLPRQYIATELFERVEVLRGASAFLSGFYAGRRRPAARSTCCPSAHPTNPLNPDLRTSSAEARAWAADVARRFGPGAPPASA